MGKWMLPWRAFIALIIVCPMESCARPPRLLEPESNEDVAVAVSNPGATFGPAGSIRASTSYW